MTWAAAVLLALAGHAGITVSPPGEAHVDAWIRVPGTVRIEPGERRPVRLQERTDGEWHVMDRARSRRAGRFVLVMRSGPIPHERTLRVVAPRAGALPRAATRPFRVGVHVDVPDST